VTSARDAAAFKVIFDTRASRLTRASSRAESWIAGLTALVTVLTTAMVVKGPENFAKAEGTVRGVVLMLVILGAAGIWAGLVCAYSAAFGGLVRKSSVDKLVENPPTTAQGAAAQLDAAATRDAHMSRRFMRLALGSTVLAMVCLTAAIAFSWFATPAPAADGTSCVDIGSGVLELSGEHRQRRAHQARGARAVRSLGQQWRVRWSCWRCFALGELAGDVEVVSVVGSVLAGGWSARSAVP